MFPNLPSIFHWQQALMLLISNLLTRLLSNVVENRSLKTMSQNAENTNMKALNHFSAARRYCIRADVDNSIEFGSLT